MTAGEQVDSEVLAMGKHFFGYGRWDAPFWFIGPEAGQGKDENDEGLTLRAKAWRNIGAVEVCDCVRHHELLKVPQWHREKPRLQPTWRPLILFLKALHAGDTSVESLSAYQRDRWGMQDGSICMIELSGLPAHSFKVSAQYKDKFLKETTEQIRRHRIGIIRERISTARPKLILMFSTRDKKYWEEIAGGPFAMEMVQKMQAGFRREASTVFVLTPHPVFHGMTNDYWLKLAQRLRDQYPEFAHYPLS